MTRSIKQILAACLVATFAFPGLSVAQQAQQAKETVKATHGAWEVVCATAQPDLCVMRQIGTTAEGEKVLEVRVRKLEGVKTEQGETVPAAIRITTPLGTLLQPGVRVQVDSAEPRTGLFEVCVPNGCIVEDPMSSEFLGRLKAGVVANMTFGMLQKGEINVGISLNGFTAAFSAL